MTAGKRFRTNIACLCLPVLFFTGVAHAAENRVIQSENQLQQIQGRIEQLRSNLNTSETLREQLSGELRESEKQIGLSAIRLHRIGEQLHQQQSRLDDLEERFARQQAVLQDERHALQRQLRAAYAMGRQQRLKILLNQQDPAIVSRLLVYYDYFNRARLAQMEKIERSMDGLRQSRVEIIGERAQLLELQSRELAEREQQEINRQQRQEVVDALNLEMRDKNDRLAALVKDREQLQVLLNQLKQQLFTMPSEQTEKQSISALKGKLKWPVKGRIVAGFGSTKAANLKWDGTIIAAPTGREVRAIHRGRVAFADWMRGFGLLLILDHGGGYMSLYGHNQSLFRETGEWVEADEPVALVGNSGGRTDSGVYFGIRVNGDPVDPKKWCQRLRKGNRISFSADMNSVNKGVSNGLRIPAWVHRRDIPLNITGSSVEDSTLQVLNSV